MEPITKESAVKSNNEPYSIISLVKTSTLAMILGVMVLSVLVFANEAEGAGLVWRAVSKLGSLISDLGDVAGGCTNGEVMKYQTSNSTWICGTAGFTNIASAPQTTATILANNNTVANSAVFKTITQGTDIVITNGSQAITIAADIANIHTINNVTSTGCAVGQILKVSGTTWNCAADDNSGGAGFTNITPIGTTASSGNATLIHSNATNSGVFKNISAINGTSITNGTSELIIQSTYIVSLQANVTTSLGGTDYAQIFRIPLTANSGNALSGTLVMTMNSLGVAPQITANVTNPNTSGQCLFQVPSSATALAIDTIVMNNTNPTVDTGTTAPFPTSAGNGTVSTWECSLVTGATPGDFRLLFQSETAGTAVNIKQGSYYIKTP